VKPKIDKKTHALATRIATRLFTNGCAEIAQRLVLTVDYPAGPGGRDLGGWCFNAAVDQIAEQLSLAAPAPPYQRPEQP